ncbi:MAG: VWA domain-containing protein [Woeseiaceae bacterium]|nr:VWA domain-containing protein [Woeseiaceae bacterium]
MLTDFHWLRPEWLLMIPGIILLVYFLARSKLGSGNWDSVIDRELMPYVLSRESDHGKDYRWWLMGFIGVVSVIALAGPAWQRIEQPVFRAEHALVVALDLSRSMDAQDITPSRLQRAKLKILDMLERRKSGQTALVVYSANAFTVTPLTMDTDTIASLVNSLGTDIMPSRGSYPEVAIAKGKQLLEQAEIGFGKVILITDGGSSPAASAAARDLKAAGYTLSVLGVGTIEGAPIPHATNGFVTDSRGQIAVPKLEEHDLRTLVDVGGGVYARISDDERDLDRLLFGEKLGGAVIGDGTLAADRWREEGPWLLLFLLPLAALAFRRGLVIMLIFFIAPLPQTTYAATWNNLWLNKDQQAKRELEAGNATNAAALFKNRDWQAVADYEAGDYVGSASVFSENNDTRNLYNFGNAMALKGDLDAAIEAYEQVLERQPDNEDAAYNLDLVMKKKDQQEQQNQGEDQESVAKPGEEGEKPNSEEQSVEQRQEGDSSNDSELQEGDSSKSDNEETLEDDMKALQEELQRAAEEVNSDEQPQQMSGAELAELRQQQEQEQAMEQWLRRIPDDPGGLLRRKFRYQYQRSGIDQDGNSVWPDNESQPW